MSGKVFFDTNILIYAFDRAEPEKRRICAKLVRGVLDGRIEGVISNQVLGELSNALLNKVAAGAEDTKRAVSDILGSDAWLKLDYTSDTVRKAVASCTATGMPFWDSVIAETMRENGISEIVTENERDFRVPGIKATSPFRP